MAWLLLFIAGLLEVSWASVLPSTQGLTKPGPTAAFLVLLAGSMYLLAKATETIPLGTAYVVWTGIGAVGAASVGMLRGEPATALRIAFLAIIVVGIVGLQSTSNT
ncbi:MAG: multidrug efflux SMR transporter [Aquihabitans sp.]